jgi:hypothetical protein
MWFRKLTGAMFSGLRKWFGRRNSAGPEAIESSNLMKSSEVIWDAADKRPFISNRRGFAVNIAVAMLGLPGLGAARAAQNHLLKYSSNLKFSAKSCPAGQHHSDSTGNHVDLPGPPHADGTPHSDICIPNS